jgi:glycosyltransferase involved in cell wall biosynthesis
MPRRPLDITHVLAPAQAGGLERVVEMLAAGQVARGHLISAVAILPGAAPEPPTVERLGRAGVSVSVLRVAGRAYAAERRNFAGMLTGRRRGLVHTHGYRADVLYGSIAAKLGFATVSTLHGFTGGDWKNRFYEFLQRRAARRFDRVVCVSRPIVERLKRSGADPDRLRFIANAFQLTDVASRSDARSRLELDGDSFVVGWVGRLSREKGADVLVSALAHLTDLPISAMIIGDGPEVESLRDQAKSIGVDRMIRWAGTVIGAGPLYTAFDVLALSSRTEGTPIVLFEAMAARVPIVATAVGGIPDMLTSESAQLVPPENPVALAAAIRSVFELRDEATVRAERARHVLGTRFAPEPWLAQYDDVYAESLEHAGLSP